MKVYITQYGKSIMNNQEYDLWSSMPQPVVQDSGAEGKLTGTMNGSLVITYDCSYYPKCECLKCENCQYIGRLGFKEARLLIGWENLPNKLTVTEIEVNQVLIDGKMKTIIERN